MLTGGATSTAGALGSDQGLIRERHAKINLDGVVDQKDLILVADVGQVADMNPAFADAVSDNIPNPDQLKQMANDNGLSTVQAQTELVALAGPEIVEVVAEGGANALESAADSALAQMQDTLDPEIVAISSLEVENLDDLEIDIEPEGLISLTLEESDPDFCANSCCIVIAASNVF